MAIIFGTVKGDTEPVAEEYLKSMASATAMYAQDGSFVHVFGCVGMGFQPYYTHHRSRLESQPLTSGRGNVIVLDGRLDNQAQLRELLDMQDSGAADSLIMLTAFERWGENCFGRFVGDWALAIWSNADRSLYLARDHAGTRTLSFEHVGGRLLWSTCLETFFFENRKYELDEDFTFRCLAGWPTCDLTPYKGIRVVPAGHYLKYRDGCVDLKAHWTCLANEVIHYKTEMEYQEHLFELLKQSVERRDGPGCSVLAQLSGGMDSSSIVCLSDHLRRECGSASKDLIDTVSYYDDSEPNWNERPYFTVVEQLRGKEGVHLSTFLSERCVDVPDPGYLWPGGDHRTEEAAQRFEEQVGAGRFRAILSGVGGDELLGGRPDPLPELADYLTSGKVGLLCRQTFGWCLPNRTPLVWQFSRVLRFCSHLYLDSSLQDEDAPVWISKSIVRRRLPRRQHRSHHLGVRPSAIYNSLVWQTLLETLPHLGPGTRYRYEYRYPLLDRDLVDFLLRVPPIYLRKPGRRRYLMRKTLEQIVPSAILERRRKAFMARRPIVALQAEKSAFASLFSRSMLASAGFIDQPVLQNIFEQVTTNSDPISASALLRTIGFESWLQGNRVRLNL